MSLGCTSSFGPACDAGGSDGRFSFPETRKTAAGCATAPNANMCAATDSTNWTDTHVLAKRLHAASCRKKRTESRGCLLAGSSCMLRRVGAPSAYKLAESATAPPASLAPTTSAHPGASSAGTSRRPGDVAVLLMVAARGLSAATTTGTG